MKRISKGCHLFIIAIFLLSAIPCSAQLKSVSIESIDSSMSREAKPLLILLSTDWCKYCQLQKNQLQNNKEFLNQSTDFYYVEFNGESKEKIHFLGQEYQYKATGVETGLHELAVALNGSERVSFPTWVLLDSNYQVLFRYNGVLASKQLNELIAAIDKINKKELPVLSVH